MKKVAATSGQSVSFADFLFVWEITRGRAVAGSETVLNLCRFLLERSHSGPSPERVRTEENTDIVRACKKNIDIRERFFRATIAWSSLQDAKLLRILQNP